MQLLVCIRFSLPPCPNKNATIDIADIRRACDPMFLTWRIFCKLYEPNSARKSALLCNLIHAEPSSKGANATNNQYRETTTHWLFYFLVRAAWYTICHQWPSCREPAVLYCMLLVRSDSTHTALAVVGLLEDIAALLSV